MATALASRTARLALDRDTISNYRFRTMSSFVTPAESGNRAAQAVPQNSRPAAPTTGHKLCTSWRAIIGCSPSHRPSHGVLPFTVEASCPHAAAQRSATTPACLLGVSLMPLRPAGLPFALAGSQPTPLQPAVCTAPPGTGGVAVRLRVTSPLTSLDRRLHGPARRRRVPTAGQHPSTTTGRPLPP